MAQPQFTVRSEVHRWPGHAGWHFVTVPRRTATVIHELFGQPRRGWNSIPVTVHLGASLWQTSIFWAAKNQTYIMGLKAAVRRKEKIRIGRIVRFTLRIRDI